MLRFAMSDSWLNTFIVDGIIQNNYLSIDYKNKCCIVFFVKDIHAQQPNNSH